MKARDNKNIEGKFVDRQQASQILNLGLVTVRKLAEEAGASIKIGRAYRIDIDKLIAYIESNYQC